MNIQNTVDQAGRLLGDLHRQTHDFLSNNTAIEEPKAGELWERVSPQLEKALAIYERKESPDIPESSWIPGRTTKKSCQENFEGILDTVLTVLGTCGAAGYRTRIRSLQAANVASQTRIAQYRERLLSASAEKSQNFAETLLVSSKEGLTDSIADETDRVADRNQQVENLKTAFRQHLQHLGINVSPEIADSFLLPIEDDIVAMAAVISNIGLITQQLQDLVDASKEAPAETKRYYGMYVLLVFAVDRIQSHFIQEIDQRFLPKIAGYEKEAADHVADARAQVKAGGPRYALEANIAANRRTIEACHVLAKVLQNQRRNVLDENRRVRMQEAAAVNTYRTVCLSVNVAELIGYCQAAFRALRELRLPALRPFQSVQLNQELQTLAERGAG